MLILTFEVVPASTIRDRLADAERERLVATLAPRRGSGAGLLAGTGRGLIAIGRALEARSRRASSVGSVFVGDPCGGCANRWGRLPRAGR